MSQNAYYSLLGNQGTIRVYNFPANKRGRWILKLNLKEEKGGGRERNFKQVRWRKAHSKMGDLNLNTSMITLNISRLNALIKRQDYQLEYKNKTVMCSLQETRIKEKEAERLTGKWKRKICHINASSKKAGELHLLQTLCLKSITRD